MRDIITTVLEVAGLLCIDAGVAIAGGQVALPVGCITGGLMLLGSSLVVVKASTRKAAAR